MVRAKKDAEGAQPRTRDQYYSVTPLFLDGYEGYFEQHKLREKISTTPFSRAPILENHEYLSLVSNSPHQFQQIQEELYLRNRQFYGQWMLELSSGFNICLYGLGSKRELIMDFLDEWDPPMPIVVVNCYNPASTLKDLLNKLVQLLIPPDVSDKWFKLPGERLLQFLKCMEENPSPAVLVIHSLDGPLSRVDSQLELLVRLIECPCLHLLASIDSIYAPILMNGRQSAQLNLVLHNTPTYKPYTAETAHTNLLTIGQSRVGVSTKNVKYVLSSLTTNSQELYRVLLGAQYENMVAMGVDPSTSGTVTYGISYEALYNLCVEQMIVSTDMNFKVMLSEFIEHRMAEKHKSKQGDEIVYAPYSLDDLEQLIAQMDAI